MSTMRFWILIFVAPVVAAQPVTFFRDDTTLVVSLDRVETIAKANECDTLQLCASRFRVEDRTQADTRIAVKKVVVNQDNTMTVALDSKPQNLKSLFLVAADYLVPDPANPGTAKSAGRKDFQIKPQVTAVPAEDQPNSFFYQSVTAQTLADDLATHVDLAKKIAVSDPAQLNRPYPTRVISVESAGPFFHTIRLGNLPRAKKLDLTIAGIDTWDGKPVGASGSVATSAFPKTRDAARVWITAGIDADDVKSERKYKLDTRLHYPFALGNWTIGPTFDAIVGNTLSKAPNAASLAADFRYYFNPPTASGAPGFFSQQNILLAPIFRTDRDLDNHEIGFDVAWEPRITALEKPLEHRRLVASRQKRDPFQLHWGFTLRPTVAMEMGQKTKSISPEVEGEEFVRARAGVLMMVEFNNLRLSLERTDRHLFTDELTLNAGTLITTTSSHRDFFRGDLQWDFGFAAITLTHLNGHLPPVYTETSSTSLGITLKY
ncbi:MAG TPA: hypothetical protein VEK57_03520 [Thermoanaerobaculia bacterium]|nr:hypothetical protein [Thermoanaerobaculia bacterium]